MSSSLGDILGNRKSAEPPEFTEIRRFIRERFGSDCRLQLQNGQIVIIVAGSALAGSIKLELHELEERTGKKLRLRIG